MVVLGIDPGSAATGYGVIDTGRTKLKCVTYGAIRTQHKNDLADKLKIIYASLDDLIREYDPRDVALEDVFFGHNIQSALKLGQARGAAILAAANNDKPVFTYAARAVKQALTGNGGASKEQVQRMIQSLLGFQEPVQPLDASDALAIAVCHARRRETHELFSKF